MYDTALFVLNKDKKLKKIISSVGECDIKIISNPFEALVAAIIGYGILGLRGHYFAICTLGLGIAAGELAGGIELIGAGQGMTSPPWPKGIGDTELRSEFFYYICFVLMVCTFLFLLPPCTYVLLLWEEVEAAFGEHWDFYEVRAGVPSAAAVPRFAATFVGMSAGDRIWFCLSGPVVYGIWLSRNLGGPAASLLFNCVWYRLSEGGWAAEGPSAKSLLPLSSDFYFKCFSESSINVLIYKLEY